MLFLDKNLTSALVSGAMAPIVAFYIWDFFQTGITPLRLTIVREKQPATFWFIVLALALVEVNVIAVCIVSFHHYMR